MAKTHLDRAVAKRIVAGDEQAFRALFDRVFPRLYRYAAARLGGDPDATADVVQYCQNGDGTIEFRGVPGAADVFDILYFGTPTPFASDSDENELLISHRHIPF